MNECDMRGQTPAQANPSMMYCQMGSMMEMYQMMAQLNQMCMEMYQMMHSMHQMMMDMHQNHC